MTELVSYRFEDSVATITMDDGKVNVMSPAMQAQLNAALDRAAADQAIVVLTGRPGAFSAGFDLATLNAGGDASAAMVRGGFELSLRLLSFPLPVVVGCTGHALAMGAFLALSADFRIGVEGPFKLGANEVAIGLTMPHFAIELCAMRLTPAHLQRAMLTAEIFDPRQAVEAGFLDQVVTPERLPTAINEKAKHLLKLNLPAHTATKQRLRAQSLTALRLALDADDAVFKNRR